MPDQPQQALQNELTVIRCQLGEREALDELVERWHPPLWRYIRRMVEHNDQAEEAAQETWVRVLRALPRLREPKLFATWFFGIARRVLMDRLRSKYTRAPGLEAPDPQDVAAADPPSFDAEEIARLHDGLSGLPLIEREAITLFSSAGLSLHHIAEITRVPEGTVKSRLHRARRLLRETLETKGTLP